MHYQIDLEDRLYIPFPDRGTYELIREALTVRRQPTLDQAAYNKCLLGEHIPFDRDKYLTAPRGFMPALLDGLNHLGHTTTVKDKRYKFPYKVAWGTPINLREYQEDAVRRILEDKIGIVVAPPAAGKTVLTLEAIRRSGQRAIIIVDKKNLLTQWAERCWEFLHVEPNIIGGGMDSKHAGSMITVAMQQSLANVWSESHNISEYGFAVLDECHHISADTYLEVFDKINSYYRIGISATPYRDDGLDKISQLVIGPLIYKISSEELLNRKFLVKPKIVRVKTRFEHNFWSTHHSKATEICQKPGCKKNGISHGHKNNYMQVTKALTEDCLRMNAVVDKLMENINECNLIVSDRLNHLHEMREMAALKGFPVERMHMLTGKENPEERAEVSRKAAYGSCAIFSTIAKEALDIPRLDRLYLTWPIKREHILEQQIGRITRSHPDKREAIVYDFFDEGCSVLASQAWSRFHYYRTKNYSIQEQ